VVVVCMILSLRMGVDGHGDRRDGDPGMWVELGRAGAGLGAVRLNFRWSEGIDEGIPADRFKCPRQFDYGGGGHGLQRLI
jgi:hypothetical protein